MKPVTKREALREAGVDVPRSNEDVDKAYGEMIEGATEVAPCEVEAKKNIFTYVGAGETPPHMIDFMGLQRFIRGQPVVVTNSQVLSKIKNHPCFVAGEIEQDQMFDQDELAKKRADKQRQQDAELQTAMEIKNKK